MPRDLGLLDSMNQFPLKPLSVPLGPIQIFWKIPGDIWTTGVVDTGGKWKKSLIRKVLIILFGHF